jgi:hypothetical protein
MNLDERHLAKQVFDYTIPYSRIFIIDRLGLEGRPYTTNNMSDEGRDNDTFHLHVGPTAFSGMQHVRGLRELLIHELTHVWQSVHSVWPASFIFNSLWHQITSGGNAYSYKAGQPWGDYNVEQQASIVEDWFAQGQAMSTPLYPYIRDHIRTAKAVR